MTATRLNLRDRAVAKFFKPRLLAIWAKMDNGNDVLATVDQAQAEIYRHGYDVSRETLKKWRRYAAKCRATLPVKLGLKGR